MKPLLAGLHILFTAGPTQEPIDPVRYLTNRSSGRMGYALAEIAAHWGATVTLVSGPTALQPPAGVSLIAVRTAQEMHDQVMAHLPSQHIVVGAAAVADYTPRAVATQKLKKQSCEMTLVLQRTPDIIAEVAAQGTAFVVGFAAETHDVVAYAASKLAAKKLDMIIANDVSTADIGFDVNDNAVTILWPQGRYDVPRQSKQKIAEHILQKVKERYETIHPS